MHVGAAVEITTINGYDSFANVEDLYEPSGVEEEVTKSDRRRGSWWALMAATRTSALSTRWSLASRVLRKEQRTEATSRFLCIQI
jgi:hypothetical protein